MRKAGYITQLQAYNLGEVVDEVMGRKKVRSGFLGEVVRDKLNPLGFDITGDTVESLPHRHHGPFPKDTDNDGQAI